MPGFQEARTGQQTLKEGDINRMTIKLFVVSNCPQCEQVKELLLKKEIPFEIYDTSDADGLAEFAMLGVFCQKAPLLVVKDGDAYPQILSEKEEQMDFIRRWTG